MIDNILGRKLGRLRLGATRMRCAAPAAFRVAPNRVPRALAAMVRARSHLSPWSRPTRRVQNLKCRAVDFRRPRVRFAGRGPALERNVNVRASYWPEHRRDGRSFVWPVG
jgi:hypothetical protein